MLALDASILAAIRESASAGEEGENIIQGLINELEAQGAWKGLYLGVALGFVELLWQLSAHALREVHRRNFPADVAENPLPASFTEFITQNSHASALLAVTKLASSSAMSVSSKGRHCGRAEHQTPLPGPSCEKISAALDTSPHFPYMLMAAAPAVTSSISPLASTLEETALPSERAVKAAHASKMQARATPSIPRPAKSMSLKAFSASAERPLLA
ncbi:hypothetical protein SELMODRAFT_423180 [Selaginella moellendorffii]|uniref:Uncharacterized protein n=1 Tax=Selaginella moellendorffii TaxID=88036 RepID=D8SKU4_SELML|nr:hypothetical protein SELMODRAFT_423180 [Selaginella moellendorffii]